MKLTLSPASRSLALARCPRIGKIKQFHYPIRSHPECEDEEGGIRIVEVEDVEASERIIKSLDRTSGFILLSFERVTRLLGDLGSILID